MRTAQEMHDRIAAIREQLTELDEAHRGETMPEDAREDWNRLNEEHDDLQARISQNETRHQRIAELRGTGAEESIDPGDARTKDRGLYAIERMKGDLSAAAGDRLEALVRRSPAEARYLDAVSDPAYNSAFGKRIADPDNAHHSYTREEAAAVRKVAEVSSERALAVGTGSAGGFAVPATLDPTILLTSDGRINPIRELATVTTIATDVWQGVSSAGVVASWDAEGTEVSDDTPTLAQPEIKPEKLAVFVPFSIEVGQDWGSLQAEMATLFADAKDEIESEAFTTGTGSGQPEGLLTGGTASVTGSGTATVDDYYELQEAVPPRFQPRATFLSSNAVQNDAYRLVAEADATEPRLVSEDRQSILGKPWREVSHMVSGPTGDVVAYGDIGQAYRVVDRLGLTVELVRHLFGGAQRPTGQRGLYAYARVGGGVVNVNAVRKLTVS